MKSRCIHICILLCLYVYNLYGQTPDDNIIITKCSDSYIFEEKDGIPIVSNRKEISYEATRMGASLQPHTYYGEFISLDKASAKGGGKASHQKMSSLTTAKSAFSISTLIGKGKKQKHRSSALFTTCIILRGSTWAKTTSSEKSN